MIDLAIDLAAGERVARSMAGRFAGRGVDRGELTGEALLALAVAAASFKPSRGIPFLGFASVCVRRRLAHVCRRRRPVTLDVEPLDHRDMDPVRVAHARDRCQAVRALLHDRDWRILWAVEAEGHSLDQAGRLVGISRQRAGLVLGLAVERIRSMMPNGGARCFG